jgi:carboxylate-amine ligase
MPLQVEKAVALGVFVRRCAALALDGRLSLPEKTLFNLDSCNRFLACRDGINAELINPFTGERVAMRSWFMSLLEQTLASGTTASENRHLEWLRDSVNTRCDAQWMRSLWKQFAGHEQADLGMYCQQISNVLLDQNPST